MRGTELRTRLRAIMERTTLTYYQIAAVSGVSPSTTRFLLNTVDEELRGDAHAKLVKFALANETAKTRADVRLV